MEKKFIVVYDNHEKQETLEDILINRINTLNQEWMYTAITDPKDIWYFEDLADLLESFFYEDFAGYDIMLMEVLEFIDECCIYEHNPSNDSLRKVALSEIIDVMDELVITHPEYIDPLMGDLDYEKELNRIDLPEVPLIETTFEDIEKIMDKSLGKFNEGSALIVYMTDDGDYSLRVPIKRTKKGKITLKYSKDSFENLGVFKSKMIEMFSDSYFATINIRVKTNSVVNNNPLNEIYIFKIGMGSSEWVNIDSDTVRKSYSINFETGEPIELLDTDIFCDLDGNRTAKIFD